jgi:4-hydroxy-2-oxoheptanedioate aldolase
MSHLRRVWRDGGVAVGAWLTIPDPHVVEITARAGFDYVCIDMQHGLFGHRQAVDALRVIGLGDSTPVVRVPWNEPAVIGRVLDAGAMAVIAPMVNDAMQAEAMVRACRYAPRGDRSYGPVRAGLQEGPDYFDRADAEVLCIPMIETATALENLEEILAVPGLDAAYVGPNDLSITLGLAPGTNEHPPALVDALARVLEAVAAAGLVPAIHGNSEVLAYRRELGFRMITVATDADVLSAGLRTVLELARR